MNAEDLMNAEGRAGCGRSWPGHGEKREVELSVGRHHVALPAHCANQLSGGWVLELAAQVIDINIDDICGLRGLQIPYRVQQLYPRHAETAVEHQVLQQGKLLVGEYDRAPRSMCGMLQAVQFQVA